MATDLGEGACRLPEHLLSYHEWLRTNMPDYRPGGAGWSAGREIANMEALRQVYSAMR